MLDNTLREEIFPNVKAKPPLVQLEASSYPVTCNLGEGRDTHM